MEFIFAIPTWTLAALLLALMFAANEADYRLGGRSPEESESSRTVSNGLKASVFGVCRARHPSRFIHGSQAWRCDFSTVLLQLAWSEVAQGGR